MPPSNKRRKLLPGQVEDLTFDSAARQEYLSGFSKRKQARIQHARELAVKREREDRIKERRQIREQRKEEIEQHVQAVNAELKKQNRILNGKGEDDTDVEEGVDDEQPDGSLDGDEIGDDGPIVDEPLEQEEEYVDEDKYTTVTVEPMGDMDSGVENDSEDASATNKQRKPFDESTPAAGGLLGRSKPRASSDRTAKPKAKKKKFRYESKAERAISRKKQKSKNSIAKARRKGE